MVLERDVPGVKHSCRAGLEEDASRPQNVTALGERNARVPNLYGLAERHRRETPLYLTQGYSTGQASAHRRVVVKCRSDEPR
jgi:hypothetical protein